MWDQQQSVGPKQEMGEDCPAMQFSLGYMGCRKKRKA